MIQENFQSRFSAQVRIVLTIGDEKYSVAKVGPDHLVFRTPPDLPPCTGTLQLTVDGHEHRWTIYLRDGVVPWQAEDVFFDVIAKESCECPPQGTSDRLQLPASDDLAESVSPAPEQSSASDEERSIMKPEQRFLPFD